MKILLILALFFTAIFADFYIINGETKVKMSPLKTGKIDFSTFNTIAHIQRGNDKLHAFSQEIAFNHRHLNFRLATIGLVQTNYTITEFSKKAKNSSDSYYINFDNYTRDDGVMLQLFYKNNWYAVILGNPLHILQNMFLKLDVHSPKLDLPRAVEAIKQARIAFPLDDKLKMVDMELENRKANEVHKSNKDSILKQTKIYFK